jgi:hypothetical protein
MYVESRSLQSNASYFWLGYARYDSIFFFSSLKFWPKFLKKNLFCSTGIALPVSTHRPELLNLVTTVALLQYEF